MKVRIPVDSVTLDGDLVVPAAAAGMVVFAHGDGTGRVSSRSRVVAEVLRTAGLGTLLVDLPTDEEEAVDPGTMALRFNVPALADRVVGIIDWVRNRPDTRSLPVGLFGSGTMAGAALLAAATRPHQVAAVVSRSGRPDLAGEALGRVQAPTLLVVGGRDLPLLLLNRDARFLLGWKSRLEIVAGAGHLFEEPGALDEAAKLAAAWFATHLGEVDGGARVDEISPSRRPSPVPETVRQ